MRILLIDIDTLRADHLGCYGYHRDTSPNIDKIADEGVRFTNFYTSNPPCLPNRTAFWSGRFGVNTGVVNHGGEYADMPLEGSTREFKSKFYKEALGTQLNMSGLHTATISSFASRHSAYQFLYGFNEVHDPVPKKDGDQGDLVYDLAKDWVNTNAEKDDWFLHVHFWDPHTPYDHPVEFAEKFKNQPIDDWLKQEYLDKFQGKVGFNTANTANGFKDELEDFWTLGTGKVETLEDAKKIIDGYDAGILYSDYFIGKIIDQLKEKGVYDDTIIIVTADHGENFGELNAWGEHMTVDQATARIPLIIKGKNLTEKGNKVRSGLHYQVDLSATLLDIVGRERPESWDGVSFKETLKKEQKGRDYLVMDSSTHLIQRSVRWDDNLLIRTYHCGTNDYPQYMLFNVKNDPHEMDNLAEKDTNLLGQGMLRMDDWAGQQMRRAERGDPIWHIIKEGGPLHQRGDLPFTQHYLEQLKHTPKLQAEYKRVTTHYGVPRRNVFK